MAMIFIIGMLPIVSAGSSDSQQKSLGTLKQYDSATLIQSCVNSTYSNISMLLYPNKTFAINSATAMIKNGNDYYYIFNDTSTLGTYLVYGNCDENGIETPWQYDFKITTTGNSNNLILISYLILALFSLIILLIGFWFKEYTFVFISGWAFMLFGLYSLIYGWGFVNDMFSSGTSWIIIGLGIMFTLGSAVAMIEQSRGNDAGFYKENDEGEDED